VRHRFEHKVERGEAIPTKGEGPMGGSTSKNKHSLVVSDLQHQRYLPSVPTPTQRLERTDCRSSAGLGKGQEDVGIMLPVFA